MHKNILSLVMLLTAGLAFADLHAPPGGKAVELIKRRDASVYSLLPTCKIMPNRKFSPAEIDKTSRRLYFAGAPGETEQLQLVFKLLKPCTELKAEFSILKCDDNIIEAKNFKLGQLSTVKVPGVSLWFGLGGWETGNIPDPVDFGEKFDLPEGKNSILILEVTIPRNTKAGSYKGKITLKGSNQEFNFPVEVVVWPFEMPANNAMSTAVCGVSIEQPKLFERFKNTATHVKYGSYRLNYTVNAQKNKVVINNDNYAKDLKTMRDKYNIKAASMPPSLLGQQNSLNASYLRSGIKVNGPGFSALHKSYLSAMRNYLKKFGLEKNIFYYPLDEFHADLAPAFVNIARESKKYYPEMPVLALTDRWHAELDASDDIDIWCVPWHFFITTENDPAHWEKLRKRGIELWSYMNSLYCINASWNPQAMRFFPLILSRYDYSGALWWHVCHFKGKNVRDTAIGLMNAAKKRYLYGSGYLFYPPKQKGGQWGSSLRWENYAQGVEDYNLMELLKKRWTDIFFKMNGREEAFNAANAVAMYTSQLANTFRAQTYYGDPFYMNRFRQLLAHDITSLPKHPYALVNFEPKDTRNANTLHIRGMVEKGAKVSINGKPVDIWQNGKVFTCEMRLKSGLNSFKITIKGPNGKIKYIYREVRKK